MKITMAIKVEHGKVVGLAQTSIVVPYEPSPDVVHPSSLALVQILPLVVSKAFHSAKDPSQPEEPVCQP